MVKCNPNLRNVRKRCLRLFVNCSCGIVKRTKMAKKKRNGIKFPKKFMKWMKCKKRKKMRNVPIDEDIVEQQFNDAERGL